MDINKLTLIGRLTAKPERRTRTSGQPVATFRIATNYVWRDFKTKAAKQQTEFHRVVVMGKLAEIAAAYLDKGSRVYVEGRLHYRASTDRAGRQRRSVEILGDEIIMLGHHRTERKSTPEEVPASPRPTS